LFEALQGTPAWRDFIAAWREQAERDPKDRKAFRALIRPGASPR
jgi:hypothetical protein